METRQMPFLFVFGIVFLFFWESQPTKINIKSIYSHPNVIIPTDCLEEIKKNPLLEPQNLPVFSKITPSNIRSGIKCARKFSQKNHKRIEALSLSGEQKSRFMRVIDAPLYYINSIKSIVLDVIYAGKITNMEADSEANDKVQNSNSNKKQDPHKELTLLDEYQILSNQYRRNAVNSKRSIQLLVENVDLDKEQFSSSILNRGILAASKKGYKTSLITGPWLFGYRDLISVSSRTTNDVLRDKIFKELKKVGNTKANNNIEILESTRRLFTREAKKEGFNSLVEMKMSKFCMAKSSSAVEKLLIDIESTFANKYDSLTEMTSKKCRKLLKFLDDYFNHEHVLRVTFERLKTLFEISIVEVNSGYQVYADGVKLFNVFNELNEKIGLFYIDFFKRPGSKLSAKAYTRLIRFGMKHLDMVPLAFISLNVQSKDVFTLEEIRTLFHELGHCLQYILADKVKLTTYGDTNEFASMFMEHFAKQEELILMMSSSTKKLSAEVYNEFRNCFKKNELLQLMEKIHSYLVDIYLFQYPQENCENLIKRARQQFVLSKLTSDCSYRKPVLVDFNYAGTRYGYIWSKIMAIDAYDHLHKLNSPSKIKKRALKFRKLVLEMKEVSTIANAFQKFMGRKKIDIAPFFKFYDIHHKTGLIDVK